MFKHFMSSSTRLRAGLVLLLFGVLTAGLLTAGLLTAGCGSKKDKLQLGFVGSPDAATTATLKVENIKTVPVEAVEQSEAVRLTGTLEADEKAQVASRVSGNVLKIYVDRGSIVKAGDPLVELDAIDARNALATGEAVAEELRARLGLGSADESFSPEKMPEAKEAKAAQELTEANYKRYNDLNKEGIVARSEYDKAKADNDSARQRYEQCLQQSNQLYQSYRTARTRLVAMRQAVTDTMVRAPFTGLVVEKLVALGERVDTMMGGGKVVLLVRIDPLRLVLTVPQQYSGMVKPGQEVAFEVDGSPGKTFTGKVTLISPSIEAASRSMKVEALVANPEHELRPGYFATAKLELGRKRTALYVPEPAVLRTGDTARVFVVRDGLVREQLVAAGETVDGRVEIKSGLAAGDRIVADPAKVRDGARIG